MLETWFCSSITPVLMFPLNTVIAQYRNGLWTYGIRQ